MKKSSDKRGNNIQIRQIMNNKNNNTTANPSVPLPTIITKFYYLLKIIFIQLFFFVITLKIQKRNKIFCKLKKMLLIIKMLSQ